MITIKFSEMRDGQEFRFLDRTGEAKETSLLIKATAHITTDDKADSRTGYTYLKGDLKGHFFQVRSDFNVAVEYIKPSASERIAARRKEKLEAQKSVDKKIGGCYT